MSRSFIVRTNQDKNLNLKDFMDNLQNLITFNTTDLKIAHNRKEIYPNSFDKVSLNTEFTVLAIDDAYIYITYHGKSITEDNKFWWYIESRALEGRGRSLFVASACVIANLTDGLVDSADGAWHNPDIYHGSELWNEYLNIELNYH